MKFDWDDKKAKSNEKKHYVSFEEATIAFQDEFAVEIYDANHSSVSEKRFILIGEANERILFIVYTVSDENTTNEIYRLISAREAETWEVKEYEQERFKE